MQVRWFTGNGRPAGFGSFLNDKYKEVFFAGKYYPVLGQY